MDAKRVVILFKRLDFVWQALGAFLFPPRCAACRQFGLPSLAASADPGGTYDPLVHARGHLCPDCLDTCQVLQRPICSRCGLMFKSRRGEDHRCSNCLSGKGYYGIARAVGIHAGGLMAMVHQLKYQGRLALVHPMGRMLQDTFEHYWHSRRVDLALPIPLHRKRWRRRGFNQAALLLRACRRAARKGIEVPDTDGRMQILMRTRPTPPQTGLNRRERQRNIRGAFRVVDRDGIQGQRLLIFDDVFTTGATLQACADAAPKR